MSCRLPWRFVAFITTTGFDHGPCGLTANDTHVRSPTLARKLCPGPRCVGDPGEAYYASGVEPSLGTEQFAAVAG